MRSSIRVWCKILMVESVLLRRNDLAAASIVFLLQAFRNLLIDGTNVNVNLDNLLKNEIIMFDH